MRRLARACRQHTLTSVGACLRAVIVVVFLLPSPHATIIVVAYQATSKSSSIKYRRSSEKLVTSPLFLASRRQAHVASRTGWTNSHLFPLRRRPTMSSVIVATRVRSGGASAPTPSSEGMPPTTQFSKRVLVARVLVVALIFGLGFRLGVTQPEAAIMKRLLVESSATGTTMTVTRKGQVTTLVLASTVVGLLLRDGWNAIPAWAKPSIVKRAISDTKRLFGMAASSDSAASSDTSQGGDGVDDDISDFTTLAMKLKGVMDVAKRRMSADDTTMDEEFNLQASFFALLTLIQQLKASSAPTRDEWYASCGPKITSTDVYGLDEWMDLADAAYNEFAEEEEGMTLPRYLQERGYDLIKHDKTVLPGYLGHYVALDQTQKVALIGVKGTSSLEDLITDMCGAAISYELQDGPFVQEGPTTIRAHEGILLSSKRLADTLQPLVEKLLLPSGYQIVVVGHSLGAAAAALLAVLLQSRIPDLRPSSEQATSDHKLHVYAFASPPNLDLASAQACESFVTTIVNNCDVIPRCNAGPVLVTMELLKVINQKLLERQALLNGDDKKATKLSGFKSTWQFIQSLRKQRKPNDNDDKDEEPPLMTSEELAVAIDQALNEVGSHEEDQDQLYVSGKVFLMYDLWEEESKYHEEKAIAEGSQEDSYDYSADRAVVAKPTAKVLRYLEFDGRMVEDHLAPSYKSSLRTLCR